MAPRAAMTPLTARCDAVRRADRGVSSIELAGIGLSLVFLIFFGIQVALYLYGRSVALQSARDCVSLLRLAQNQDQYAAIESQVRTEVEGYATSIGSGSLDNPDCHPHYDDAQGRVTVQMTGQTVSLVPFVHLSVTVTASGIVERFQQP